MPVDMKYCDVINVVAKASAESKHGDLMMGSMNPSGHRLESAIVIIKNLYDISEEQIKNDLRVAEDSQYDAIFDGES